MGAASRLKGPGCGHTLGEEQRRAVEEGRGPREPWNSVSPLVVVLLQPTGPRSLGVGCLHSAVVGTQEENSVETHVRKRQNAA